MRVLLAVAVGGLLAVGATVGLVNVADTSPSPVNKPLYNYGSR
ncbi:hypothetical protein OG320_20105 [Microbispora sp. NBC_01189]|uniref:DUF2613 family protein n=1 Tax=Microbispora amethystogenes TaxID=1427754 RepID=A0ABQ4FJ90_9ACTN|nr:MULTISPECIES: hypothetical protein [Microbispora]WSS04755.1 hypothetical protein OG320_20105 [Microbispora sp. NBC_01189]GIH34852.1 hypothetical protein Mam01_50160 [Microbispora amethystogenes]